MPRRLATPGEAACCDGHGWLPLAETRGTTRPSPYTTTHATEPRPQEGLAYAAPPSVADGHCAIAYYEGQRQQQRGVTTAEPRNGHKNRADRIFRAGGPSCASPTPAPLLLRRLPEACVTDTTLPSPPDRTSVQCLAFTSPQINVHCLTSCAYTQFPYDVQHNSRRSRV